MRRLALLPLFASLASAAVVGDYDPMPTSPACDKFCGAWTCASRGLSTATIRRLRRGSGCCVTALPRPRHRARRRHRRRRRPRRRRCRRRRRRPCRRRSAVRRPGRAALRRRRRRRSQRRQRGLAAAARRPRSHRPPSADTAEELGVATSIRCRRARRRRPRHLRRPRGRRHANVAAAVVAHAGAALQSSARASRRASATLRPCHLHSRSSASPPLVAACSARGSESLHRPRRSSATPLHELRLRERVDALSAHTALDLSERRGQRRVVHLLIRIHVRRRWRWRRRRLHRCVRHRLRRARRRERLCHELSLPRARAHKKK